jgi:hypothetical protein
MNLHILHSHRVCGPKFDKEFAAGTPLLERIIICHTIHETLKPRY